MRTLLFLLLMSALSLSAFSQRANIKDTYSEFGVFYGSAVPQHYGGGVKVVSAKRINGYLLGVDYNCVINMHTGPLKLSAGVRALLCKYKTQEVFLYNSKYSNGNIYVDEVDGTFGYIGGPVRLNIVQPITKGISLQLGAGSVVYGQKGGRKNSLMVKADLEGYAGLIINRVSLSFIADRTTSPYPYVVDDNTANYLFWMYTYNLRYTFR